MDFIVETFKKNGSLHHAYVIEGRGSEALVAFIEGELRFPTHGNPDFWHRTFEGFGIDEARELRDVQSRRAFGGGRKIFLIESDTVTVEAQNALLKVFEEPTEGTHIFFLVPSATTLLPTLLSRVVLVRSDHGRQNESSAKEFLAMNHAERSDFLKNFIGEKSESRVTDGSPGATRSGRPGDKDGSVHFLESLQAELRARTDLAKASSNEIFVLEQVGKAISYLRGRSPSVKILLEHVAAILPKTK